MQLTEYSNEDEQVKALAKELDQRIFQQKLREHIKSLNDQWAVIQNTQKKDPILFEHSAQMLLQTILAYRIDLASRNIDNADTAHKDLENQIRNVLEEIANNRSKQEEKRHADAKTEYQRWAISQVKKYDSVVKEKMKEWQCQDVLKSIKHNYPIYIPHFPSLQEFRKNAKYSGGFRYNFTYNDETKSYAGWKGELGYKLVRDAMITYLLPIDTAMLEPSVYKYYEKRYEEGWKAIQNRDDQTYVAEQSAIMSKKPIRDFLEVKP